MFLFWQSSRGKGVTMAARRLKLQRNIRNVYVPTEYSEICPVKKPYCLLPLHMDPFPQSWKHWKMLLINSKKNWKAHTLLSRVPNRYRTRGGTGHMDEKSENFQEKTSERLFLHLQTAKRFQTIEDYKYLLRTRRTVARYLSSAMSSRWIQAVRTSAQTILKRRREDGWGGWGDTYLKPASKSRKILIHIAAHRNRRWRFLWNFGEIPKNVHRSRPKKDKFVQLLHQGFSIEVSLRNALDLDRRAPSAPTPWLWEKQPRNIGVQHQIKRMKMDSEIGQEQIP